MPLAQIITCKLRTGKPVRRAMEHCPRGCTWAGAERRNGVYSSPIGATFPDRAACSTPKTDQKELPMAQPTTPKDAISATGKVSNPAPLGLAAFGVTTVVLSSINAGWVPTEAVPAVVPLAFSFGGLAQFIAGFLEYGNGNTFGMVAFTSYGGFWWWYAFLNWTVGAGWIKAPDPRGVGVA